MQHQDALEMEIVPASEQLAQAVEKSGLTDSTSLNLQESFKDHFAQADQLTESAMAITVTSEDQKKEMATARRLRMEIKAVRVAAEKTRKTLKEDSLRTGKAIDGVANILKFIIAPVETHLKEQEEFAARAEEKRREALSKARAIKLEEFEVNPDFYDLAGMTTEAFDALFQGLKAAHENKIAAEKKAEADRIAREKAEADRIAKQAAENARLKAEAEAREKQIEAERKKVAQEKAKADAAAKIEADRIAKEREAERAALEAERKKAALLEREAKARAAAELAEKRAAEKKRRAQLAAPDAEKIRAFADVLADLDVPKMGTEDGQSKADLISSSLMDLVARIRSYASDIENA